MRKNFLEFVSENEQNIKDKEAVLEAFKEKEVDKALDLIEKTLKKHIPDLIPLVGFVNTEIDGNKCITKQYIVVDKNDYTKSSAFEINWLNSAKSSEVYSIDFFKDLDVYWNGNGKADLSIYTLGTSIVRFLPIIWDVVNSGNYNLQQEDAIKLSNKVFKNVKESKYYVGGLTYHVFEGYKKSIINDAFIIETEASDLKRQKSDEIIKAKQDGADSETLQKLTAEYAEICKAIRGGAETSEEIKLAIEKGKRVKIEYDKTVSSNEKEADALRKDPEQVFKEMSKYISLVLKGLQPSLILCGAPGVGKTFRVKKQLKEGGYTEGKNLCTIKGKCTARKLYLALYEYQNKNDIVLIDDADSLVGPKADENCINILKAALDSTTDKEGRLVTYGIAGKILDDEGEEVPKRFYYKGGCIVITNYRAGQLDTALRGRSFIQDINFNNGDVLKIIERLLPNIEPDILDAKSKLKSLDYLKELNEKGSKMELSLRTFVLCAKIFKACDGDDTFTDEDAQSMIEEQMKLQYARGGHKY